MKLTKKIIAVFLSILTLFSIFSASTTAFAAEYAEQKARTEYFDSALSGYLKNIVDTEDAVSISEKEQVDQTVEEVNSSIARTASTFSLRATPVQSTETAKEAAEDLDIDHTRLTLELEDGENVAYLFSEPISFIDDEGNLVYKDTNIKTVTDSVILNRGYSYENGNNDHKAYFSEDSARGLLLVDKDGEEVRLVPNGTKVVGTLGKVESDMKLVDSFEYNGVYGTDTVLRFLPQLNGCKEEIVLSSYQGVSDFSFTLHTQKGTIAAINSNGEVEIIDSATKDIITTFVAPFANDSSGGLDVTSEHYTDCTYELEMVAEGKYILTISVPKEYLESENTVYPVIIDPTTDNISMYLDTSVYSALSDEPQGSNPTACFGKTDTSEYGKGRAMFYFKLPTDIKNYAQISSAKFWLRETTGRTAEMYVRPYLISESWTNQVTWDTQPKYYNGTADYPGKSNFSLPRRNINSASTDDPESPYWYAFNIVYAVRAWTTGTTNLGLKFIAECEAADGDYLWRAFATKDHTTSSYRPYAVIKYTNDVTPPEITDVLKDPDDTYTNKNVTVTVSATDNVYKEGGISKYSFDNGKTWQTSEKKTYKEEGTYTPKVIAKDLVSLESDTLTVSKFIIDKTAPEITSVKKSITSEWANSNVKVTINASDKLSGMNSKGYYFDSSKGWQADNYKTYSAEGTYTVTPKARDKVPNTATESNVSVKIDKTAPVVKTPTKDPSSEWSNTNVTVTNNATDALSGIASSKGYSFDNGLSWQNEKTKTYSTEGTYTVTPKAKDKATNEGIGSAISVKIDKTAPVVKLPTKNPSTEWSNTNVTVTNNATDALSGIATSNGYSFNNGSSWQNEKTKTYSTEGTYTVTPKAKDKATNIGAGTAISVKIDKTVPTISKIEKAPSSEWSKTDVKVTVTASDALSGVATSNGYSFNNGTDWQTNNYKTYSAEGTYTVTSIVKDKATNKSASKTTTVKIDKTAPTATVTGTVNGSTVDITVTASDALSGLHATAYSFDGGTNWQSSNTKKSMSANTTHTIVIRDKADNRTTIKYNPKIGSVTASPSLDTWTNSNVTLTVSGINISQYNFDSGAWSATEKSKSYSENKTAKVGFKESSGNITYINVPITNIDSEKPVITSVTLHPESGWANQNVTATVNASDTGGSGIYAYSADNGNSWQDSNVFTFSELTEAKFLVKDNAGNSSEVLNKEILIDKEAPILDLTGGCDDWSNEPITVVADANDAGDSGIFGYSFDGGNAWVTDNRKVYEESTNEIVSVAVKDNAGNVTEKTAQVMVDIDAPAISDVTLSSTSWTKENVIITVTASDVMSGLADTAYSFDGGTTWQEDNTYTASENGTFNIVVKDKADNETSWDEIVIDYIDKTIPNTPDLYEQDGLVYISSRSFDFNEETDSPEHIEYKIENGEWTAYDGEPLNIVRTYDAKVYARVRDDAENISPIAEIELENTLGEYTASYTDIALGEGLFPVEFGRTYTSTKGWFFTFDANVVKIDDNAYVFTDFYGEKQYFIKNGEGKYLSIDDEELTINADSYVLTYGDMTCTFDILDGKINRIVTDYLDTAYTWEDNKLTIDGGATVTFSGGKPTGIEIERENKKKNIEYNWTTEKILETDEAGNPTEKEIIRLTSFKDAAGKVHVYDYLGKTELLTKNDTETITYYGNRVSMISQPNGAFVKYIYKDKKAEEDSDETVKVVIVSDSKGVTDTIPYSDGVYISSSLDSYSDKASYDSSDAGFKKILDATQDADNIDDEFVYVVEEQETGNNQNGEGTGTGESTPGDEPESDGEPATDNDIGEETNGVEPDTDGDALTDNEAGDTDVGTENGTESGEDNNASSETETPLYEEIDEDTYAFYTYDEQKRVTAELEVLKSNITDITTATFESAELVAESKVTYAYLSDEDDSITVQTSYIKSQNGLAPDEKECYTYENGDILTHSKYKYVDIEEILLYDESYEYNTYGNVISHTETQYATDVDAFDVTYTTSYTYDVWGMCVKTEVVCGDETDTTITEYDLNGVTLSVTYNDERVKYSYNDFGSVTTETVVKVNDDDTETFKYSTTYTYDEKKGNLLTCKNPDGDTSYYHYDTYGNLTWHTFNGYYFEYNTLGSIMNANVGAKVVEKDEINENDETIVKYEIEDKGTEIVAYNYEGAEQELSYIDYKNGQRINYIYDEATGDLLTVSQGEDPKFSYSYSTVGEDEITTLTDSINSIIKVIENDKVTVKADADTVLYSVESLYEDEETPGSFNGKKITVGSDIYTLKSEENKDSFYVGEAETFVKTYEDDYADNLWKVNTANAVSTEYGYNEDKNISTLKNTLNGLVQTFGYGYDDEGNITTETLNIVTSDEVGATIETNQAVNYTYDENNQLKTADYGNVSYEYIYDYSDDENIEYNNRGNITKKIVTTDGVAQTVEYVYDTEWKDKLISYNGQSISYDVVGNPIEYLGDKLTWTMGRQLAEYKITNGTVEEDDYIIHSYTYNEDGIRTSKTVNTVTTTYYLDGTNIIEQNDGTNTLHFYYDSNDEIIGFTYNEAEYFYVKNAMSDIIGIVDNSGNLVTSYAYDAWGKVLSVTGSNTEIANLNPFRYRSYYYDTETEFYYLQSRYYDPEVCRFINSDEVNFIGAMGTVNSYNAFTYCENNPVNRKDSSGCIIETFIDLINAALSFYQLIKSPSWTNLGYLVWDVGSTFVPFVPGSYTGKAVKTAIKIADDVPEFKKVSKVLTNTYSALKKKFKGIKGIEIHHLVEKRFEDLFLPDKNKFLSAPLTKKLHKEITKRWRNVCPYGTDYNGIGKKKMKQYVKAVYYDMPKLKKEILKWVDKYWTGDP